MRIAIATTGRFHVLDLARELSGLGEDVTLHSWLPNSRTSKFGLPAANHRSTFPYLFPLALWGRLLPKFLPIQYQHLTHRCTNYVIKKHLQPCDVFICMSGIILEAAYYAKEEFNAQIWLHRGSQHVLAHKRILDECGGESIDSSTIERELRGYELADRIVVGSQHVWDSFVAEEPSFEDKLFLNPYGVDLNMFYPKQIPARQNQGPIRLLSVGNWSKQKGADLIEQYVRGNSNVTHTHVGAIQDCPFPTTERFRHIPPVPQWDLNDYYNKADVFILASRQDGFGAVIGQALAAGLPVVCTQNTGGPTLTQLEGLADRLFISAANNFESLRQTIDRAITQSSKLAPISDAQREQLSWRGFALRYQSELSRPHSR